MTAAIQRHLRFYAALLCGLFAYAAARLAGWEGAGLAGGVIFYLVFLALCAPLVAQQAADLKTRARSEDEGIAVVVLITLATMVFFCEAVFVALNRKGGFDLMPLLLAGSGALLGWLTLHTIMAFHYANLHYFTDPDCANDEGDLDFPGKGDPGPWDFLYFSFVIGMTAQVSDVAVRTMPMRRAVLLHGMGSFFFNTVFIAMAVNAAVAMAD
jgi:uncharacterized membrane protein